MDSVYLSGSEEVAQAACNIVGAADTMNRAAQQIDSTLTIHQRWLDDWLCQLRDLVNNLEAALSPTTKEEPTDAST